MLPVVALTSMTPPASVPAAVSTGMTTKKLLRAASNSVPSTPLPPTLGVPLVPFSSSDLMTAPFALLISVM